MAGYSRLAMDRVVYPLLLLLGTEFTADPVLLTLPGDKVPENDRWIDVLLLGDEPVSLAAFASLRVYSVRIRLIKRRGGQSPSVEMEHLLDQVERLKNLLIVNHRGTYWLDGQIGAVTYAPDFSEFGEIGHYIGAEMIWTCKIEESIS